MRWTGRRIAAALVLTGVVLASGWGLWVIRPVLAPFLLAVVIAYLIAPLVNALAGWGLSRGWAILAVYGVLSVVLGLGVVKLLPQVLEETRRLTAAIPTYSLRARQIVDGFDQQLADMGVPEAMRLAVDRNISDLERRSVQTLEGLLNVGTVQKAAGLLLSLLLAPFLALYLLKDMERFKERFVLALPRRHRMEILALLRALDGVLAGFVRGQLLLGLAVGIMSGMVTRLLGLRYAVLLGLWAGVMEFVPYVGPILGAVPAVLAGMAVSTLTGLEAVLAFAIIQQLEGAVLAPKIMGESVGLHPLAVMLSILAGGYLLGWWGLILALPLVGLARVLWCFLVARLTEQPR